MFETLAEQWKPDGDEATWVLPETWGQGRAAFGGLTTAACLGLARSVSDRTVRTVHTQFLNPLTPGPVRGRVETLREGRSTHVVEVRLYQNDRLAQTCSVSFVSARADSTPVAGPPAPEMASASDAMQLPYIPGVTPEFTQHVEFRFAEPNFPYQGGKVARFAGYVRFTDDDELASHERTLALLDAWPCPTLAMLSKPAPASSVNWTAHLLAEPAGGLHQFVYETRAAADGYSTAVGTLWDAQGRCVAWTEQTVAVFG